MNAFPSPFRPFVPMRWVHITRLANMDDFVTTLTQRSTAGALTTADALRILQDEALELMDLLLAAYRVRRQHFGKGVQVHIINNAQNGHCPEDCSYCSQAKTSEVDGTGHEIT